MADKEFDQWFNNREKKINRNDSKFAARMLMGGLEELVNGEKPDNTNNNSKKKEQKELANWSLYCPRCDDTLNRERFKLFIVGSYKVGKTTVTAELVGPTFATPDEVKNTKGEIIYPVILYDKTSNNYKECAIFDTEGFHQPLQDYDVDVIKQIILEQIYQTGDLIVYVVDRLFRHDIDVLRQLFDVYSQSQNVLGLIVIHNVRSIKKVDELKEYALQVQQTFRMNPTANDLHKKQIFDPQKKDKVIEHLFMGDKTKLNDCYETQINIVRSMIFNLNSKQKIIRQELLKAMKNVLFKYYEFNMNTEGLLKWNDIDFEKKENNKDEKKKDKEQEKASAGPIYNIICNKEVMKKRQADNRGALWEPVIVKVIAGTPRKEVRIVDDEEEVEAVVDVEIDCSGLLLKGEEVYVELMKQTKGEKDRDSKDSKDKKDDKYMGQYDFKVTIIDDQTISVSGYKKQMKNNNSSWDYLNVSHTFKLKNIMNSERNQKRTQKSFKRTDHGSILGYTLVNVKL